MASRVANAHAQAKAAYQAALSQPPQQAALPAIGGGDELAQISKIMEGLAARPPTLLEGQSGGKREGGKSPSAAIEDPFGARAMQKTSPSHSQISPRDFASHHAQVDGGSLDDFIQLGGDFAAQDATYQDYIAWPSDYPVELDLYPNAMPLARADLSLQTFPELSDISSASDPRTGWSTSTSMHTRATSSSIMSASDFDNVLKPMELAMVAPTERSIPEFQVVVEAEKAWNLARCNPPADTATCPRTAIVHLECLEQKSKQEGTWRSLEKYLEQTVWDPSDMASVVPLTSRTRDKMLAITQSFLHKALEIHRGGVNGYPKSPRTSPGDFNFIVLPPSHILEHFLRSYVRSLTVYYPLVTGCVDPNEMLQNNQASTLLVLLMIAQGAAAMPMAEARWLSAGLTETCRISLFDIVEKDVELSADPIALRCALLFIVLGAWSGDKWLMDIAMGQRGMYMSVSRCGRPRAK